MTATLPDERIGPAIRSPGSARRALVAGPLTSTKVSQAPHSDVVRLTVEVRRLAGRVAALEELAGRRFVVRPRLGDRVIEIVAARGVIEGREIIRLLALDGGLDHYQQPDKSAWMAILRETWRGRLVRVERGRYAIGG